MEKFIAYLSSISPLSEEAKHEIRAVAVKESFAKGDVLIHELAKCQHLYFIEKGLARAYFYHNEKEITDWFGMEGMVIGPILRNFPVKETKHSVVLLEDTTTISVSFADLEMLYYKHHEIERLGRLIAIYSMLYLQNKIDSIQLLSAKERYQRFLADYPNLIQRVPLGYIASFLGMNQVTLSRVRKYK